jgi:hypothetical protein
LGQYSKQRSGKVDYKGLAAAFNAAFYHQLSDTALMELTRTNPQAAAPRLIYSKTPQHIRAHHQLLDTAARTRENILFTAAQTSDLTHASLLGFLQPPAATVATAAAAAMPPAPSTAGAFGAELLAEGVGRPPSARVRARVSQQVPAGGGGQQQQQQLELSALEQGLARPPRHGCGRALISRPQLPIWQLQLQLYLLPRSSLWWQHREQQQQQREQQQREQQRQQL